MSESFQKELDVLGEESPTPVIRTKEVLDTMASGEVLKVLTSKQSAVDNIQTLTNSNPFTIIKQEKIDDQLVVYIQKD